jgi:hypothetical protein
VTNIALHLIIFSSLPRMVQVNPALYRSKYELHISAPLSSCASYKFPSTMRTLPTIGLAASVQTVYTYVQVPMYWPHLAGHAITLSSNQPWLISNYRTSSPPPFDSLMTIKFFKILITNQARTMFNHGSRHHSAGGAR